MFRFLSYRIVRNSFVIGMGFKYMLGFGVFNIFLLILLVRYKERYCIFNVFGSVVWRS